jgi:exonuclease SbcD
MRFLHTADWHVGKALRGRSRMDEHAAALQEVAAIAVERRVDAVLVAGDVFDSPAPPPEAEKLVYDFLARLLAEGIAAVLIAGNHDHPKKLGALASLLEGLRIHVRAEVRPPGQGGVVRVASRDGTEEARVAVLPFVPERKIGDACAVMDPEHAWHEAYSERIEQILAALVGGLPPSTVNLAIGHVLVAGSLFGTGERRLHLGEIYGLNPQQLPSSLQYIGLGHLHRPQEVPAPSKTLYSGSLVELDFGEKEQEKRVVVVEAKPGEPAAVESVPLSSGRRLRDVVGTLEELRHLAGEVGDAYLRVTVKTEAPVPGIAEQVRELLPNAVDVAVDHPREDAVEEEEDGHALRMRLEPGELFAQYYERKNGAPPSAELSTLFQALYEEAQP